MDSFKPLGKQGDKKQSYKVATWFLAVLAALTLNLFGSGLQGFFSTNTVYVLSISLVLSNTGSMMISKGHVLESLDIFFTFLTLIVTVVLTALLYESALQMYSKVFQLGIYIMSVSVAFYLFVLTLKLSPENDTSKTVKSNAEQSGDIRKVIPKYIEKTNG